jgi:DNA-binding transcriptional MocR family regulator
MAAYLGVPDPDSVYVPSHSTFSILSLILMWARLRGMRGHAWENAVMLVETPAYDRYLTALTLCGIQAEHVPMTPQGPDIEYVRQRFLDKRVVGMICVPKYQNPTGLTYAPEVLEALASVEMAHPGAVILMDNAYAEHHVTATPDEMPNIWDLFSAAGRLDRLFLLGSWSKVTMPGESMAALASGRKNLAWIEEGLRGYSITPQKLPQLQHVNFLPDMEALRVHMQKHRACLEPRFRGVDEVLRKRLGHLGIARWRMPSGGYFISLRVAKDCARRAVAIAGGMGLILTGADAGFASGNPDDDHIRLAPTSIPMPLVVPTAERAALAVELAHLERYG